MKRVLWLCAGLLLITILLAACGDSPTVAIQPSSLPNDTTQVPVTTVSATTIVTTTGPVSVGASSTPNIRIITSGPVTPAVAPTLSSTNLTALASGQVYKVTQGTQGQLPNCTVGVVSLKETNGQSSTTIEVTSLGILRDLKENDTFTVGNVRYRITRIFVPSSQSANNRGNIEIKADL